MAAAHHVQVELHSEQSAKREEITWKIQHMKRNNFYPQVN
jgi:hypothetical protein